MSHSLSLRDKIHRVLLALFFIAFVGLLFGSSRMSDGEYLLSMFALAVFGMRLNKAMTAPR